MRVWLTGGGGFVGSNIVHAAVEAGHEVMTTVHTWRPDVSVPFEIDAVDMTDTEAVQASVASFRPDMVVHCAILNDLGQLYDDRQASWDAYVEATRSTAGAASSLDAAYVLVSTDWVFDGTQGGADEETPPNPVNLYGTLKLASEMVALERGGAVARVSGVNGIHRARPETPRAQDAGFGYFVASLVDAARAGLPFTVWESDAINMVATPSHATECGELIVAMGAAGHRGVFHCCGADTVSRMELAHLTCDVFELDPALVRSAPPPPGVVPPVAVPYDTGITSPRTAELLDHPPTPLRALLERFRTELEM